MFKGEREKRKKEKKKKKSTGQRKQSFCTVPVLDNLHCGMLGTMQL